MKDHVRILLIGDSGVGKSSLISSYVSRHFPEEVPPIMTDAIIPPDTTANNVCVTIMDSSARPGDREVLKHKIRAADSVIALYDVTRPETFDSLLQEWLPLVRDISNSLSINKAVVLVGTKIDLVDDTDDVRKQEETERLRLLLSNFPFVLACCRASAKLLNVDTVFYHGELVVSFPLYPIFDVDRCEFTRLCKQAFLRIFRIFDVDNDDLLSDCELCTLQQTCFDVCLKDDDVTAVKKQISKVVFRGLRNNKTTFEGLVGIMSVFIERSQPQIPWTILRKNNYNDELDLIIPEELDELPYIKAGQIYILSKDAELFIYQLAINAIESETNPDDETVSSRGNSDSNADAMESITTKDASNSGFITLNSLNRILSVIPSSIVTPWDKSPLFEDLSIDKVEESKINDLYNNNNNNNNNNNDVSTTTNNNNNKLANIFVLSEFGKAVSDNGEPIEGLNFSMSAWISQWYMLAALKPKLTQILLYRLGYLKKKDNGIITSDIRSNISKKNINMNFDRSNCLNNIIKRVCLLGDDNVGKTSFIYSFNGVLNDENNLYLFPNQYVHGSSCKYKINSNTTTNEINRNVFVIITEVPYKESEKWLKLNASSCDAAIIMFSCKNVEETSYNKAREIELLLPNNLPRLYIASKKDEYLPSLFVPPNNNVKKSNINNNIDNENEDNNSIIEKEIEINEVYLNIFDELKIHLKSSNLESLREFSSKSGEGMDGVTQSLLDILLNPDKGIPLVSKLNGFSLISKKTLWILGTLTSIGLLAYILRKNKKNPFKDIIKGFTYRTNNIITKKN